MARMHQNFSPHFEICLLIGKGEKGSPPLGLSMLWVTTWLWLVLKGTYQQASTLLWK